MDEREGIIQYHFSLIQDYYEGPKAVKEMKKHLALYTRGLRSSASFRMMFFKIKEREPLLETMRSFFKRARGETHADPSGER